MEFGVYLPTYAWPDLTSDQAARIKEFAQKAEAWGFDALWVGEHFLVAGHYGTAWMSPLLCLAHAASVTSRIRLATGVLVLPYYHPLTLARQIQTLYHLSRGRFVLGVGPGWDQHEFESLGMRLAERGARTDEILAALRRTNRPPASWRVGPVPGARIVAKRIGRGFGEGQGRRHAGKRPFRGWFSARRTRPRRAVGALA